MIKRGQCSNSPSKCSNAANGTLLAYAGTNSICPECGAPLALVAGEGNSPAQPSTPPPVNTQRQAPPPVQDYDDDYAIVRSGAVAFVIDSSANGK